MCLLVDTVCVFPGKTAHGVEGAASGSANWSSEVFLDGSHTHTQEPTCFSFAIFDNLFSLAIPMPALLPGGVWGCAKSRKAEEFESRIPNTGSLTNQRCWRRQGDTWSFVQSLLGRVGCLRRRQQVSKTKSLRLHRDNRKWSMNIDESWPQCPKMTGGSDVLTSMFNVY